MIRSHLPRHVPKPKRGCKGKLGSVNVFFHVTNGDAPSNVNACCINSCTLSNRFTCLQDRQNSLQCLCVFFRDCGRLHVVCFVRLALWPPFKLSVPDSGHSLGIVQASKPHLSRHQSKEFKSMLHNVGSCLPRVYVWNFWNVAFASHVHDQRCQAQQD